MNGPDTVSFPGGFSTADTIVAVKLGALRYLARIDAGEVGSTILKQFLEALVRRNPQPLTFEEPYGVRARELHRQRRSLAVSHLESSWFDLAYWSYGLLAVASNVSRIEPPPLEAFTEVLCPVLRELGVQVSANELLWEIDRFVPRDPSPLNVEAAASTFVSFVRFLHRAALRRRELVRPGLALPPVAMTHASSDESRARDMSTFLASHGVPVVTRPEEVLEGARLLVVVSREAMASDAFWDALAHWKRRPVSPMVVCLMPKAALYANPPTGPRREVWDWLANTVAVEVSAEVNRYVMLLSALDAADFRRWWWKPADAMELGVAVDALRLGIPRPRNQQEPVPPTGLPYPYVLGEVVEATCVLASGRLAREASGRDLPYFKAVEFTLELRLERGGEPYLIAWVMLVYRTWVGFGARLPGHAYSDEDAQHARTELHTALFALGVACAPSDVPPFVDAFGELPWKEAVSTIDAVDARTVAFVVLVDHLSHAALTRQQRMRLVLPMVSCFVSYARADETFVRELVAYLEAKGADVWLDLNAITLGKPLDASLRAAVADTGFLFLVATDAADQSSYVRLEAVTAIERGLRIVPVVRDGRVPAAFEALIASRPAAFEPVIDASAGMDAFASALARLTRTPGEQVRWLTSQPLYAQLRDGVARARGAFEAKGT